jgi:hypothetical protein
VVRVGGYSDLRLFGIPSMSAVRNSLEAAMTTILIPTILEDIHAAAVALALDQTGHRPVRWFCCDFPEVSTSSFSIGANVGSTLQIRDHFGTVRVDEVDVLWHRRVGAPTLTSPMAESDREFAAREAKIHLDGLLASVSARAFAVNDYHQARVAENKLVQLQVARKVGLTVPETLVSNDPQQIRRFVTQHEGQGVIFKPFGPATWVSDNRFATIYTSRISARDLPGDDVLKICPGIYQAYIPKAYEVRVTCMGGEAIAARLDSQRTEQGRVDWRIVPLGEMSISPSELPLDVKYKCQAMLKHLGLVFGCFDFIFTPNEEHVFLEVNQMGQFLWIEQVNPEIPLLQVFTDFLLSRDPTFIRPRGKHGVSFHDLYEEAVGLIQADYELHRQPARYAHIFRE